jgi:phage terminase small subunit
MSDRKINRERRKSLHQDPETGQTQKRLRFIDEYLIDLNPGKAYLRAGYKVDISVARKEAAKLLLIPEIQDLIIRKKEERAKRTQVSADKVVQELAKIGFANLKDFINWDSFGFRIKDSSELKPEQTACLSEIQCDFTPEGFRTKFKTWSKVEALQMLGQHLGMFEKGSKDKTDAHEEARKIKEALKEMDRVDGVAG